MRVRLRATQKKPTVIGELGKGAFAKTGLFRQQLQGDDQTLTSDFVAIKTARIKKGKKIIESDVARSFLREQKIYEQIENHKDEHGEEEGIINYYGSKTQYSRRGNRNKMTAYNNYIHIYGNSIFSYQLILEFVAVGSLEDWIFEGRVYSQDMPFSWSTAYYVVEDILKALQFLHEICNIVHHDIKPGNILLWKNGEGELHAKVCDFGLASVCEGLSIPYGSPQYMSPECLSARQGDNSIPMTTKSDMYSFGMTLWQMETSNDDPYADINSLTDLIDYVVRDEMRKEIPEETPDGVRDLIDGCWESHPDDRMTARQGLSIWANQSRECDAMTMIREKDVSFERSDDASNTSSLS
jgi:serine/threonine protein kinase